MPKRGTMRILLLPSYYGFGATTGLGASGAGIFFRRQAQALSRYGHHVDVGYVHFDSDGRTYVETHHLSDAFREIYIHTVPWRVGMNSLKRAELLVRFLGEVSHRSRYDIVHAHNFAIGPAAVYVARRFGIPLVLTEHSSEVLGGLSPTAAILARLAYLGASRLISVSPPLASAMRRYTKKEVAVVGNLVSSEFFMTPARPNDAHGVFKFVSVGYDAEVKGWVDLIAAFSRLYRGNPDTELVLVGEYEVDGPAFQAAHQSDARNAITFTGKLRPNRLIDELDKADCYVMSSRFETFGIAPLEALARGKPVVMTRTGVAAQISSWPGVIQVRRPGAVGLEDAMIALMSRAGEFVASDTILATSALFSEDAICRQLTKLYEEVSAEAMQM